MGSKKEKIIRDATHDDEKALVSVVRNHADKVTVRGRTISVRWLHPSVGDWISDLMTRDGNDNKVLAQSAALIRLNGFWKCHLFYWIVWRWYYYIRQYSADELVPLFEMAQKNGAGGCGGVLERYNVTDRIEHDEKADDKSGSRAYPSRTTFGQRWEIASKHGIDTGPLKLFGIPISGMMYYVNWVLTNAQLELLAADVSVVDYNYNDKKE